ncbi:MAG: beta-phosphoglucomutase family hydrolase [Bryobacterales bacterium]|nr:beta-phosphoglucomutase family hydrolase [Bryobacterales bacterium]
MNSFAIILDMDGVLIDSNPLHAEAWAIYLSHYGIAADSMMERMHGKRNDQIVRDFFGPQLTDAEVFAHGAAKEALYRRQMRPHLEQSLLPGVRQFLERYKNLPLGVASNAEPANVDFLLDEASLRPYFKAVVHGHQVRHPKPAPDIYLLAARLLEQPPQRCIVFEDSTTGIEAAQSAGCRVVAVRSTPAELPETDFVIHDFTDSGLDTWLSGLQI